MSKLKLAILEKIISLDNESLLRKIDELIDREKFYKLSNDQKQILEEREVKYDNGDGNQYSWDEIKIRARKALDR